MDYWGSEQMHMLLSKTGIERLACLLTILKTLSESGEYEMLSNSEVTGQSIRENDRLQKIFDFVLEHFKEDILLEEAARIAMMSPSGFSRYFKNRTKKNFSHFVNEIRVGYACKQLIKSDFSVSYVCSESGFNNMANFNKQFKKIIKLSPYQFRRKNRI